MPKLVYAIMVAGSVTLLWVFNLLEKPRRKYPFECRKHMQDINLFNSCWRRSQYDQSICCLCVCCLYVNLEELWEATLIATTQKVKTIPRWTCTLPEGQMALSQHSVLAQELIYPAIQNIWENGELLSLNISWETATVHECQDGEL